MQKNSYNYEELIKCGEGKLFGEGNAKLPLPPMLMFDRITEIKQNAGEFKKGIIKAELDIKDNLWFFNCHFQGDPVMPGCLGLDAMWQLVGFYLGWSGEPGKGRALGVNTVKFTGEVLKKVKMATYEINIKRILKKEGTAVGLADGTLSADGKILMGPPTLTRFEKARIMGARALQLSLGAPPFITIPKDARISLDISMEELEKKVIPITIRRVLPNGDYQNIPINYFA